MGESDAAAPSLRRVMRGRDYFALAFGTIVGVGWMMLVGKWLEKGGSIGAMAAFLFGGLALVPIGYVYGRLAERMPESGTEIAYTAAVFPRGVSFATGWAMTLAYVVVCPFEAVAIGEIAGYLLPKINALELYRVGGKPVFLPPLLLGIATTILITGVNIVGIRFSTVFQNLATYGLLAIFAVFATLGFWRGELSNLNPHFADVGPGWSVLAVLPVVPYFMTGFETAPKCAEEAAHGFEPSHFLRVILLALGMGVVFYVVVIAVVALLQPWPELVGRDFPTALAFENAFGWPWLVRLIMLGVFLSLLKVFNGAFLTASRLLYALGRRELVGANLGSVHVIFQTPTRAILLIGGITVLGSFLGKAVLEPTADVGSLACLLGWLATSLAYCCGAGDKSATRPGLVGYLAVLVSAVFIVIVLFSFGPYHYLALAGWIVLGAVLWVRRPRTG